MTQPNICICYLDSSVLHTWVLSTLCKAYLEHTLPGVEKRPVCKVKLQLSISEGQHRLQAWVYRADQASWRTKASVSSGSSDQHTHTYRDGCGPSRTCLSLQTEQRPSANILLTESGQLLINGHTHTLQMKHRGSATHLFLAFVVY